MPKGWRTEESDVAGKTGSFEKDGKTETGRNLEKVELSSS